MIKRWKIANFKSIRDETTLELAPLTIFAGANSSGKSTVLQSILLIAQTLQHKISSKSVVLNGSLCNLGQFYDLIPADADPPRISIGWHCEPTAKRDKDINSIECDLSFDAISDHLEDERDAYQLHPKLYRFEMSASLNSHDSINNNVSVCVSPSSDIDYDRIKIYDDWLDRHLDMRESIEQAKTSSIFKIDIDDISLEDIQETLPLITEINCTKINHFLPEIGVTSFTRDDIASIFLFIFCDKSDYTPFSTDIRLIDRIIKSKLSTQLSKDIQEKIKIPISIFIDLIDSVKLQHKIFQKKLTDLSEETVSIQTLSDFIQKIPRKNRKNISDAFNMRINRVDVKVFYDALWCAHDKILQNMKYPSNLDFIININDRLNNVRPKFLSSAIEYIDHFFSAQVKYLGPLRIEPKHIYPIGTSIDPTDVGVRGEQTAAVLYVHRKTPVEYLPVANFSSANSESSEIERTPALKNLMGAVCEWAQYLGVVEDIKATDRGKLGYSITIGQDKKIMKMSDLYPHEFDDPRDWEFDGDDSQDITHVGVGVSQVLPILVMGLISKEDTTLIFEQPELHLHPLVQTRLADFFLSMTLLNKQCIIETHSEHLINRLRFRAASAEEPLTDTSKIYFVEKKEGISQFREVVINEYGSIEDWPSGFFDQSYTEAENILMASIKKRKKMRKRKDK